MQILKTTEYQLSNDVIVTSFCFWGSMLEKFCHLNLQQKETKVSAYEDLK